MLLLQAFAYIKHVQLEKYHKESDADKKAAIILDPFTIFHQAIENGKPTLITMKVRKSGQKLLVHNTGGLSVYVFPVGFIIKLLGFGNSI